MFMHFFLSKNSIYFYCRNDRTSARYKNPRKKVPLNYLMHIMRCHMVHSHTHTHSHIHIHFQFVLFDFSSVFIYFNFLCHSTVFRSEWNRFHCSFFEKKEIIHIYVLLLRYSDSTDEMRVRVAEYAMKIEWSKREWSWFVWMYLCIACRCVCVL